MRNQNFFRKLAGAALLSTGLVVLGGCEALDPTEVVNPTVTEDDFIRTLNAAASWTRGSERQLAATVNQVLMGTEVVSDNLFNNRTLYSKVFDIPEIEPTDFDVTNIQRAIHRLRETATRGLEVVVPADPNASQESVATLHFHRAYASLLAAELFVALPGEAGGPLLTPAEHVQRAVADFEQARSISANATTRNAALLGIARAHYLVGNRGAAVAAAQEVRGTSPLLLRTAIFDPIGGPGNTMQTAIYDSGQNEFQPLPRMDFLFPKYYSRTANDISPVAILKGEEAFLILAEAAISQGDLDGARTILKDLLGVVAQRPVSTINDLNQARGRRGGTWIYPNASNIQIQASPDEEPRAGLVLDRSTPVQVPTVSGTSVSAAMLDAATTEVALLELLYLMRQEIFVVEGRRMTDLGIRYPVAFDESVTNPNIEASSPALEAILPQWVPMDYGLDRFDYEDGDTLAVIRHNMNRVIVANRASNLVAPFH